MKLTLKLVSLLTLLLLASPLILLKGCGSNSSGACPDSAAPSGSKISAPSIPLAPSTTSSVCNPGLAFTVTDSTGSPLNGICVVVTTNSNGGVALTTSGDMLCSNFVGKSSIITRTDDYGSVVLDLVTQPTTSGTTFFVQVQSGSLSAVATTPGAH